MRYFLAIFIILGVFLAGCIQTTPICSKPDIQVGKTCCSDRNDNGICDRDETKITTTEVQTTIISTTTLQTIITTKQQTTIVTTTSAPNQCPQNDTDFAHLYYFNDSKCENQCNKSSGYYCLESNTNRNCYYCIKPCSVGEFYKDPTCENTCVNTTCKQVKKGSSCFWCPKKPDVAWWGVL